jgi:hypothetical protein
MEAFVSSLGHTSERWAKPLHLSAKTPDHATRGARAVIDADERSFSATNANRTGPASRTLFASILHLAR